MKKEKEEEEEYSIAYVSKIEKKYIVRRRTARSS
jgi:hypothetical protein